MLLVINGFRARSKPGWRVLLPSTFSARSTPNCDASGAGLTRSVSSRYLRHGSHSSWQPSATCWASRWSRRLSAGWRAARAARRRTCPVWSRPPPPTWPPRPVRVAQAMSRAPSRRRRMCRSGWTASSTRRDGWPTPPFFSGSSSWPSSSTACCARNWPTLPPLYFTHKFRWDLAFFPDVSVNLLSNLPSVLIISRIFTKFTNLLPFLPSFHLFAFLHTLSSLGNGGHLLYWVKSAHVPGAACGRGNHNVPYHTRVAGNFACFTYVDPSQVLPHLQDRFSRARHSAAGRPLDVPKNRNQLLGRGQLLRAHDFTGEPSDFWRGACLDWPFPAGRPAVRAVSGPGGVVLRAGRLLPQGGAAPAAGGQPLPQVPPLRPHAPLLPTRPRRLLQPRLGRRRGRSTVPHLSSLSGFNSCSFTSAASWNPAADRKVPTIWQIVFASRTKASSGKVCGTCAKTQPAFAWQPRPATFTTKSRPTLLMRRLSRVQWVECGCLFPTFRIGVCVFWGIPRPGASLLHHVGAARLFSTQVSCFSLINGLHLYVAAVRTAFVGCLCCWRSTTAVWSRNVYLFTGVSSASCWCRRRRTRSRSATSSRCRTRRAAPLRVEIRF